MPTAATTVKRLPVSDATRAAVDAYRRLDDSLRAARAQVTQIRDRHRDAETALHEHMSGHPRALISDGSSIAAATVTVRGQMTAAIVEAAALSERVDRATVARILEKVHAARPVTVKHCISRRFYSES